MSKDQASHALTSAAVGVNVNSTYWSAVAGLTVEDQAPSGSLRTQSIVTPEQQWTLSTRATISHPGGSIS